MKTRFLLCGFSVLIILQLTFLNSGAKETAAAPGPKPPAKKVTVSGAKEPVVKKLVELISSNKEDELKQAPLNPEEDVTDNSGEGKTYLNQTTYLRKAGIDPEKMSLGNSADDTIKKTLETSKMRYYTSLVDIDNDGSNEIRFHSVQGSLMEEDNYFFKKGKSGAYELIRSSLGCEKSVGFVKVENKTYTIERNQEDKLKTLLIYTFEKNQFRCIYTINIDHTKNKKTINIFTGRSNN